MRYKNKNSEMSNKYAPYFIILLPFLGHNLGLSVVRNNNPYVHIYIYFFLLHLFLVSASHTTTAPAFPKPPAIINEESGAVLILNKKDVG